MGENSILLIGNGPNYFSHGIAWQDVIRETARQARITNEVESLLNEPLPLVYERIASQFPKQERASRLRLAQLMKTMKYDGIHKQLIDLGCSTILTTNYDHCLEAAAGEKFQPANLEGESTYSVFRRKKSAKQNIWHIHGDRSAPRTMMLGLHQYAGYLQKLRHYLTTKEGGSPFVFGSAWVTTSFCFGGCSVTSND